MESLLDRIGAFFSWLAYALTHLPALYRSDIRQFWFSTAALAVLLLLLVLIVVVCIRRARKKKSARRSTDKDGVRMFIPVEPQEDVSEQDAIMLPLPERIIHCEEHLNRDTARRIIRNTPKSLADVVAAYDRCSASVKRDLTQLVKETRMLESYSLHLNEKDYPLGVLVDAWRCFPDQSVLRGFVELLGHRDEQVQMNAVRILSSIREPKTLALLVPALVRPDRYVTARVADVFLSMPAQSAPLLAYMLPEMEDPQKLLMLEIIAQTGAEFPIENVVACLKNKDFHIRASACMALGSGRMTAPVPQLILAANDKQWQVRAASAKALGQIGDAHALAVLQNLANDKEGWVAANAKEALALFDDFTGENAQNIQSDQT